MVLTHHLAPTQETVLEILTVDILEQLVVIAVILTVDIVEIQLDLETVPIQEHKRWITQNQQLSTKSTLDKVIRSLLTKRPKLFNFQTEAFCRELELNLWIISSMPLLEDRTLL